MTYLASFALARVSLFAAPILLANLVPLEVYGQIEFAQSIASILTIVIGLGLPATVPLILLRGEVRQRWDTLLLLILGIAVVFGLIAIVLGIWTAEPLSAYVLVPVAACALLLQGFWSTKLKTRNLGTRAVFVEAGFWAAILTGAIAAFVTGALWALMLLALGIYAVVLYTLTLRDYLNARAPFLVTDLLENLRLGLPLLAISLLATLASSLGRIVLGGLGSEVAVGNYAILYRSTSVSLVGHQLLIIAFFQRIYTWNEEKLKDRSPVIVLGVTALAVCFLLFADSLAWLLGPQFTRAWSAYPLEGRLILIQTILWSAIALNDLLTSRLGIASVTAFWCLMYMLMAVPILVMMMIAHNAGDTAGLLRTFVLCHLAVMIGYYLVQCGAVARQGYIFGRLWGVTLAVVFTLLALTALVALRWPQ